MVCCFFFLNKISIKYFLTEDDNGSAYIQILFDSKTSLHPCDTLEQASILSREVQYAKEIFQEDKMIYIPFDDENEDLDD